MEINVKQLIDEKSCIVCTHTSLSIGSDKCTACIASRTKDQFEISRGCLTCKHCKKKITEEPCMDCKTLESKLLSKWEVIDG